MCLPEVIFFDEKSGDRHSRRQGNALRPLSVDSDEPPPLLSSPPFVVQVSPKLGHHHRPAIRYQRAQPRSVLPTPKNREEMEWREGFRTGRHAVRTREDERKKRNVTEEQKAATVKDQLKTETPAIVVSRAKSQRVTPTKTTPAEVPEVPALTRADRSSQTVSHSTEPALQPPPVRQAPLSATIPAPVLPPAFLSPLPPPALTHQPHNTYSFEPRREDQAYDRSHRRRPSPSSSSDSRSSLSLRALRRRLSALWTHITSLERRAAINDNPREPVQRAPRQQSEAEIRRAREWEAAEDARRRRRMGRVVGFAEGGELSGSRNGPATGTGTRRVRRVVIFDERRRR